jgi:hypothetical protein
VILDDFLDMQLGCPLDSVAPRLELRVLKRAEKDHADCLNFSREGLALHGTERTREQRQGCEENPENSQPKLGKRCGFHGNNSLLQVFSW